MMADVASAASISDQTGPIAISAATWMAAIAASVQPPRGGRSLRSPNRRCQRCSGSQAQVATIATTSRSWLKSAMRPTSTAASSTLMTRTPRAARSAMRDSAGSSLAGPPAVAGRSARGMWAAIVATRDTMTRAHRSRERLMTFVMVTW